MYLVYPLFHELFIRSIIKTVFPFLAKAIENHLLKLMKFLLQNLTPKCGYCARLLLIGRLRSKFPPEDVMDKNNKKSKK